MNGAHPQATDFERTMTGLARGLLVRSIMASPLKTIGPEECPVEFFERHREEGFDCAPVRDGGKIIGMVYIEDCGPGRPAPGAMRAADAMRPLHDVPIVSGDESILTLMRSMRETKQHFWLVLNGTQIDGIVTFSDLQKLPVRTLAFTLITHLEMHLNALIRAECPGDSWLTSLSKEWQKKTREQHERLRKQNFNLELLEAASLRTKLQAAQGALGAGCGLESELLGVEDLRNDLAHAREIFSKQDDVPRFIDRLERTEKWITMLAEKLRTTK